MTSVDERDRHAASGEVSGRLLELLHCPETMSALRQNGDFLISQEGRRYPIVHGVPVLLLDDPNPTMWVASASYRAARESPDDPFQLETIGLSPEELSQLRETTASGRAQEVDPVVNFLVGATSGWLYTDLIGKLASYPIPELRLPDGDGKRLLDIGCNWGRWCIAAARKGYRVVGIDPSLGAVLAARRLAASLGLQVDFVVADARRLPFQSHCFDVAFSYSVLQHLEFSEAATSLREAGRVLVDGGNAFIQMPNKFGIRCLQHQWRRGFREAREFEVRYWPPSRLTREFTENIGPSRLSVDGFFGLGVQPTDVHLLPWRMRAVVRASQTMRVATKVLPFLKYVADSLYVESVKSPRGGAYS